MIHWPTSSMKLKQALDLLLAAYSPEATLNDINIILSLVLSAEEEDDEEFMREEDEDPCICVEDHIDVNCPSCF